MLFIAALITGLVFCTIVGIICFVFSELEKRGKAPWQKSRSTKHTYYNPCETDDELVDYDIYAYKRESEPKRKKHSGRCDGDCQNCPPHYGYRYGRWYYGHDHTRGCEFGGNKGGGGL